MSSSFILDLQNGILRFGALSFVFPKEKGVFKYEYYSRYVRFFGPTPSSSPIILENTHNDCIVNPGEEITIEPGISQNIIDFNGEKVEFDFVYVGIDDSIVRYLVFIGRSPSVSRIAWKSLITDNPSDINNNNNINYNGSTKSKKTNKR